MAWIILIIAGIFEILFVITMKLSDGFKRHIYTILTVVASIVSLYLLSLALLYIPVGTGYAVWSGIGAAGSVLLGMFFFGESRNCKRISFILMIITGVIGLKLLE